MERWKRLGWLAAGVSATWGLSVVARRALRPSIAGRTVVVTGGARGLGLLIAEEFVRLGARVVICARDPGELQRAEAHLREKPGADVIGVAADVTSQSEIRALMHAARDAFGPIDIVVNNAGTMEVGPQIEMHPDAYERALAIHFWAPLWLMHEVLPDMRARREGRIVNISSIGGVVSVPHMLPYSASKFALTGLSQGMRAELAGSGVSVTTVCPGLMRTGSVRHARFRGQYRREHAWFQLAAALPILSMSARRAARRIVDASLHRKPFLVLTWQAKILALMHGLFPGSTARLLGGVNRFLPGPARAGAHHLPNAAGQTGAERYRHGVPGNEIASPAAPSWLTRLNDRAAAKYNEN